MADRLSWPASPGVDIYLAAVATLERARSAAPGGALSPAEATEHAALLEAMWESLDEQEQTQVEMCLRAAQPGEPHVP